MTHVSFFPFLSCHTYPIIKGFLVSYYIKNSTISQGDLPTLRSFPLLANEDLHILMVLADSSG